MYLTLYNVATCVGLVLVTDALDPRLAHSCRSLSRFL